MTSHLRTLLIFNSGKRSSKGVAYNRQRYNSFDMLRLFMHRCNCGNCSVVLVQNEVNVIAVRN